MTYREYLKSLDAQATDEVLNVMDTPLARKAFDKMNADAAADRERALDAERSSMTQKNQEWWNNEVQPALKLRDDRITELAGENGRITGIVKQAQELGLEKVAALINGGTVDPGNPNPENPNPASPAFDPKQFVPVADFQAAYDKTGEALTQMATILAEHSSLFGSMPMDLEDLRKQAAATRGQKSLRQVWEEKYNVAGKRAEIAAAKQKEHDDKIRQETEAKVRAEYTANPAFVHARTSQNSFTARPVQPEGKPFWERDPNALRNNRVQKYNQKVN